MIEIIKFVPIDKGYLKAEVDIKLPKWGHFIIRKMKVIEKDNQRFVSFPSQEYEKDGKKQYYSYCLFEDKEMMQAFQKHFFSAYDSYIDNLPVSK